MDDVSEELFDDLKSTNKLLDEVLDKVLDELLNNFLGAKSSEMENNIDVGAHSVRLEMLIPNM